MRVIVFSCFLPFAVAFTTLQNVKQQRHRHYASATAIPTLLHGSSSNKDYSNTKSLGLITFDLDDSLYPIQPVIDEANAAFARAMQRFGYADDNIKPSDIVETGRRVREEFPQATHTEIRQLAIRREMERVILQRKLKETAADWATQVEDLSPLVVNFAKKWANEAVSPNIVQAVLNAWEMERHHAAERHLYPDVMEALAEIKRDHPDVIIGAVTDGRANPLFMTFTLAKYFDFCISWEDDQAGRQKFFQDLGQVDASAELKWIYDAALEKYTELATAAAVLHQQEFNRDNKVWIHVGDDLGLDCGGAAQSGAKTIYLELAEKYGQTARQRFAKAQSDQPTWSTTSKQELETRRVLNEAAEDKVDKKINFITRLPEAVQDILDAERSKAKTFMKQEQEAK